MPYRSLATRAVAHVCRPVPVWRWFVRWFWFATFLSRWRWYRRLHGGHWERWWIDMPFANDFWLVNEHGTRPGGGFGTPTCEHWPCEDCE